MKVSRVTCDKQNDNQQNNNQQNDTQQNVIQQNDTTQLNGKCFKTSSCSVTVCNILR